MIHRILRPNKSIISEGADGVIIARRITTGLKTASMEKVVNEMDGPIKQVNPTLEKQRARSNAIIVARLAISKTNVAQVPKIGPILVAMENRGTSTERPSMTDQRTPIPSLIHTDPLTLGQRSHI